jgi:hypothetical protein
MTLYLSVVINGVTESQDHVQADLLHHVDQKLPVTLQYLSLSGLCDLVRDMYHYTLQFDPLSVLKDSNFDVLGPYGYLYQYGDNGACASGDCKAD